jgi:hypothetical protein
MYTPSAIGTRVRHCQLMTYTVIPSLNVIRLCLQHTSGIRTPVGNSDVLTIILFRKVACTGYDVPLFVEWMHFIQPH